MACMGGHVSYLQSQTHQLSPMELVANAITQHPLMQLCVYQLAISGMHGSYQLSVYYMYISTINTSRHCDDSAV